jgi:menaquinol-cytochrome c reductase iron-sulfur subunit
MMEHTPTIVAEPSVPRPGRRNFFRWITGIAGAAATLTLSIPLVGYFTGRRTRTISWVKVGPAGDFPLQETRMVTFDNPLRLSWDGMTAHTAVYIRCESRASEQPDSFLVLAVNCAHLGCPVSWFPQSGLFMCPCHGGVYYADGKRASGPPPRGLFRCVWRIRDGQLEIQAPHYPTLQDTLDPQDPLTESA